MIKMTLDEYRESRSEKRSSMRKVRDYLKSANKNSSFDNSANNDTSDKTGYRSGPRHRDPEKSLLLFKMMARSRKAKLEKIGDRSYRLKI